MLTRRYFCSKFSMKYLSQKDAISIDRELMERYKFSIAQLMELAGLSVSHAIYDCYKPNECPNILVCCGPGNNGGDGLNYNVAVYCPRRGESELLKNLFTQIPEFGIEMFTDEQAFSKNMHDQKYNLVVDGIFGFSFKPPLRPPFDSIINTLSNRWLVDSEKNETELNSSICIKPETIVCLSAPKPCIKAFTGKNLYLGGRFLPPLLIQKYELDIPPYPADKTFVRL